MAPPRKCKAETAWIRIIPSSALHTGTILRVINSEDATALSESEANYLLKELLDDPDGYEYVAVPVGISSRYLIKATGEHYLITMQRK
jgi:hypothetical protein